jgi:hypothetical protein
MTQRTPAADADLYSQGCSMRWFFRQTWSSRVSLYAWHSVSMPVTLACVRDGAASALILCSEPWVSSAPTADS